MLIVRELMLKEVSESYGTDGDEGTACGKGCRDSRYFRVRTVSVLLGLAWNTPDGLDGAVLYVRVSDDFAVGGRRGV